MVKQPVVGAISQMLWSFNSRSQGYIECFPVLEVCLHVESLISAERCMLASLDMQSKLLSKPLL